MMYRAMKNPNAMFSSPEALESSGRFTAMQKRAILTQWRDELQQLLVADDESMFDAAPNAGASAECLRRVSDSISRLPFEQARMC
jgi:hypothetical protein